MLVFRFLCTNKEYVQTVVPLTTTKNMADALVYKVECADLDYDWVSDKLVPVLDSMYNNTAGFGNIEIYREEAGKEVCIAYIEIGDRILGLNVSKTHTPTEDEAKALTFLVAAIKDEAKDIVLKAMSSPTSFKSALSKAVDDIKSSLGVGSSSAETAGDLDSVIEAINRDTKAEIVKPKETLKDYICTPTLMQELEEIKDFFENRDAYIKAGVNIPKGILLKGPCGTGKTFAARCIAGSTDCYFMTCTASALQGMYIGSGADNIRKMFKGARVLSEKSGKGVIIFIDEIDSFGDRQHRGSSSSGEEDRTLNQLLAEMSGFTDDDNVLVLAATNFPERLDTALLRSGRFGRQITLDYPDEFERNAMIKHYFGKLTLPVEKDVDSSDITDLTKGLTPADIKEISNESAILSIRQKLSNITLDNINEAINRTITKNIKSPDDADIVDIVAIHECGHVLAEWLYNNTVPVKVTNYSYGNAGGFTQPSESFTGMITKGKYLARVKMLLGGRAAEIVNVTEHYTYKTTDVTVGASSDLQKCKQLLTDYYSTYNFETYDVSKLEQTVLNKLNELLDEVVADFKKESPSLKKLCDVLSAKRVMYTVELKPLLPALMFVA